MKRVENCHPSEKKKFLTLILSQAKRTSFLKITFGLKVKELNLTEKKTH